VSLLITVLVADSRMNEAGGSSRLDSCGADMLEVQGYVIVLFRSKGRLPDLWDSPFALQGRDSRGLIGNHHKRPLVISGTVMTSQAALICPAIN
jgi:hypothetical protein